MISGKIRGISKFIYRLMPLRLRKIGIFRRSKSSLNCSSRLCSIHRRNTFLLKKYLKLVRIRNSFSWSWCKSKLRSILWMEGVQSEIRREINRFTIDYLNFSIKTNNSWSWSNKWASKANSIWPKKQNCKKSWTKDRQK